MGRCYGDTQAKPSPLPTKFTICGHVMQRRKACKIELKRYTNSIANRLPPLLVFSHHRDRKVAGTFARFCCISRVILTACSSTTGSRTLSVDSLVKPVPLPRCGRLLPVPDCCRNSMAIEFPDSSSMALPELRTTSAGKLTGASGPRIFKDAASYAFAAAISSSIINGSGALVSPDEKIKGPRGSDKKTNLNGNAHAIELVHVQTEAGVVQAHERTVIAQEVLRPSCHNPSCKSASSAPTVHTHRR